MISYYSSSSKFSYSHTALLDFSLRILNLLYFRFLAESIAGSSLKMLLNKHHFIWFTPLLGIIFFRRIVSVILHTVMNQILDIKFYITLSSPVDFNTGNGKFTEPTSNKLGSHRCHRVLFFIFCMLYTVQQTKCVCRSACHPIQQGLVYVMPNLRIMHSTLTIQYKNEFAYECNDVRLARESYLGERL